MIINSNSLKFFKTSEKTKIFNINGKIYIGNTTQDTTFSSENCCSIKNANNEMIHNLYNSKNVYYKSPLFKKNATDRTGDTYDYTDIFSHKVENEIEHATQVNNVIYMLENLQKNSSFSLDDDVYTYLAHDNGLVEPEKTEIQTILYNRDKLLDKDNITFDNIDELTSKVVKNVEYNTVYELPGNIQNDYNSGNIAANFFKTKNEYNSEYSMTNNKQNNSNFLINARNYVNIDSCGELVFLKYYDCVTYNYSREDGDIQYVSKYDRAANIYDFNIPHVEVINGINRYSNSIGHKSNMYSIVVKIPLLSKINDANIVENIKTEVVSIVRTIVEKLAPAHTQLFNVYVKS